VRCGAGSAREIEKLLTKDRPSNLMAIEALAT
jgi:hypothetical protein